MKTIAGLLSVGGSLVLLFQTAALQAAEQVNVNESTNGLIIQTSAEEVTYTSPWLKVSLSLRSPTMTFL